MVPLRNELPPSAIHPAWMASKPNRKEFRYGSKLAILAQQFTDCLRFDRAITMVRHGSELVWNGRVGRFAAAIGTLTDTAGV
jgi:hypothetical protein